MNWARNKQTSAKGLATCSVLVILAASSPAKAQTCPMRTAVPTQTIKIFNDTTEYIFAELEVGLPNPDQWIQMACNITQTQANHGFNYATTLTNRFYINGDQDGIPPGGSRVITLPLYTQLAASVDPTKPNQYAEWWQGQNMQIFASPTNTAPPAYQNSLSGKARPDQKKLMSAATNPTWPTCIDQNGVPCPLGLMAFFTDDKGTLPKYGPSQLVEATLGATQVQQVVNDSLATSLNVTQSDFDVSYVNVAYIAAAMGPYKNNQAGYVGSPLLISQFQPKLEKFQANFNWPSFIDLDGTKAAIPKLPSTLELLARLSGANAPTDLPPVKTWPTDVWPPYSENSDRLGYLFEHVPTQRPRIHDVLRRHPRRQRPHSCKLHTIHENISDAMQGNPGYEYPGSDRGARVWLGSMGRIGRGWRRLFPDRQSAREHARLRGK